MPPSSSPSPATTPPDTAPRPDAALRVEVALAARTLPPTWPLRSFVAANPLAGREGEPLGDALAGAGRVGGATGLLDEATYRDLHADGSIPEAALRAALLEAAPALGDLIGVEIDGRLHAPVDLVLADLLAGPPSPAPVPAPVAPLDRLDGAADGPQGAAVDQLVAGWAAAYLDGDASWPMPGRERGFWAAWRRIAPHDPGLRRLTGRAGRRLAEELPDTPEAALGVLLAELGGDRRAQIETQLHHLPGWAAAMSRGTEEGVVSGASHDLVAFVAVRAACEVARCRHLGVDPHRIDAAGPPPAGDAPTPAGRARAAVVALGHDEVGWASLGRVAVLMGHLPVERRLPVWQDALERSRRDLLLDAIGGAWPAANPRPPLAHVVCCIDPRSEGLRRHLEGRGHYATIGFAGFFGLPVRIWRDGHAAPEPSYPVLLEAKGVVTETDRHDPRAGRRERRHRAAGTGRHSLHDAKAPGLAPFALAEAGGWLSGLVSAVRTWMPRRWAGLAERIEGHLDAGVATRLDVDGVLADGGLGPSDQIALAGSILQTMGLTRDFSRLVVLCGHGSHHVNNPFRSANDCGACGGRAGGVNARVAATLLNRPAVRAGLGRRGIDVPADTWFLAAEHDTATDRVRLLDAELAPLTHAELIGRLAADLAAAGADLAAERCRELPGAPTDGDPATAATHVQVRAADWSQVVPEWGLAGNHALVVGPRWLTAGADLGRRVFLHDYDHHDDPDGSVLTTILTGPMVVAHWISSQYRFSATDPDRFGAGSKPLHNVVADLGVWEGAGGDLRVGLPLESVRLGDRPFHLPGRLLVVVEAPLELLDRVVAANPVLRRLVDGGWVRLDARPGPGQPFAERTPGGHWREVGSTPATARVHFDESGHPQLVDA